MPAGQGTQDGLLTAPLKEPCGHSTQPAAVVKDDPAGHDVIAHPGTPIVPVHVKHLVPPTKLYLPLAHATHAVMPGALDTELAAHMVHDD